MNLYPVEAREAYKEWRREMAGVNGEVPAEKTLPKTKLTKEEIASLGPVTLRHLIEITNLARSAGLSDDLLKLETEAKVLLADYLDKTGDEGLPITIRPAAYVETNVVYYTNEEEPTRIYDFTISDYGIEVDLVDIGHFDLSIGDFRSTVMDDGVPVSIRFTQQLVHPLSEQGE